MRRLLVIIRRLAAGGVLGLALALTCTSYNYADLADVASGLDGAESYFCLFITVAPIFYLIFLIINTIFIRKKGWNAVEHSSKPFIVVLFEIIGSDIAAPFKCIWYFITRTIFGRFEGAYNLKTGEPDARWKVKTRYLVRFIWMVLVALYILWGIGTLS